MSFYKPQQPLVKGRPPSEQFSLVGNKRLANYSLIICTSTPVAIYRKFFYAEERNPLIKEGYVYEPGNFFLRPVVLNNPFASLFVNELFCKLFICADLNIANDKYKHIYDEYIKFSNNAWLSIVQSNTFALSSSQFKAEPNLGKLFPSSKLIIHADAKHGPFVGFMKRSFPMREHIFVYKPKASRIKFVERELIELGQDTQQYPLFSNFNARVHTGIWGCSFGAVHCIMNVWDLSEKSEPVELFNLVDQGEEIGCVTM